MYCVRVSFCVILVGGVPQDFVNVKNVPRLKKGWETLLYAASSVLNAVFGLCLRAHGCKKNKNKTLSGSAVALDSH